MWRSCSRDRCRPAGSGSLRLPRMDNDINRRIHHFLDAVVPIAESFPHLQPNHLSGETPRVFDMLHLPPVFPEYRFDGL